MTKASDRGAKRPVRGGAQRPQPSSGKGSTLQTLERAMAVLDAVAHSESLPTARDLALRCELDRAITYRILRTLEKLALVERRQEGYVLGPRSVILGNRYLQNLPLRNASLPYQFELLYKVFAGKPWAVSVLQQVGREMAIVSQVWAPDAPLSSLLQVGSPLPIEETASGRCVLATLSPAQTRDLIGESAARRLEPELRKIRAARFVAWITPDDRPGANRGLFALAVPIRTRDGRPVGGLVVSGQGLDAHLDADSFVSVQMRTTAGRIGSVLT